LSRYIIGIDLGTTNSALAYVDRAERAPAIRTFLVPQLTAPGEVGRRPLLPSFVYLPGEHELSPGAIDLWFNDAPPTSFVGEFARAQGGRVPGRLVSSSKSWLCHDRVDRRAPILPWNAADDAPRLSPVEASARILSHFRKAWDAEIARGEPGSAFSAQEIVICVPASFDAVARELTIEAAREAGIERPLLLEEPLAALYAFLAAARGAEKEALEQRLPAGSLALVVDVGGGTTDFTLVRASESLGLERTAVSDHLLLGGDNMDLALARYLAPRLGSEKDLDARDWGVLRHACREAKEALLAPDGPERTTVTIMGAGTRLVGGARSVELTREDALTLVVEGFFPLVEIGDTMPRRGRTGLMEIGLPFVADPAVTRHMGEFLRRHAAAGEPLARPTAILFNGGVLKNRLVRERVLDQIERWAGARPQELFAESFDLAVARGAAYYGLVRAEPALRIRSGLGRAYYVGVETGDAAPRALCLLPRGVEAERPVTVGLEARVQANVPVRFPFYFSSERDDRPGALVDPGSLHEMPPLVTVLRSGSKRTSVRKEVPVELVSRLTEIGTLELSCHATDGTHRSWRLELTTRIAPRIEAPEGEAARRTESPPAADPDVLARCRAAIDEAFRAGPDPLGPLPKLGRALEEAIGGEREAWPVETCRALFEILIGQEEARRRSPEHEARFWNLAGFTLRPGFGDALDEHRVARLWKAQLAGPAFPKSDAVRLEWLICRRRIAGGLRRGQQEQIYHALREDLLGRRRRFIPRQEVAEMWRLAASLEHLAARAKEELGSALLRAMEAGEGPPRWGNWAMGRFGTRAPHYGPLNETVRPEAAARWLCALLPRLAVIGEGEREGAIFAIVQMARLTGDPRRDLSASLREEAARALREAGADEASLRPLLEVMEPAPKEVRLFFGDTIPAGLRLG
jgi:molecular chaperone DnaK (HSP70)